MSARNPGSLSGNSHEGSADRARLKLTQATDRAEWEKLAGIEFEQDEDADGDAQGPHSDNATVDLAAAMEDEDNQEVDPEKTPPSSSDEDEAPVPKPSPKSRRNKTAAEPTRKSKRVQNLDTEGQLLPERLWRKKNPNHASVFLSSNGLELTKLQEKAANKAVGKILCSNTTCAFCFAWSDCLQCAGCEKYICAPELGGCVDAGHVGHLLVLKKQHEVTASSPSPRIEEPATDAYDPSSFAADFQFRCVQCLRLARAPIPPMFTGSHYYEALYSGDASKEYVCVHLIGHGIEAPDGLAVFSDLANRIPASKIHYIRFNADHEAKTNHWRSQRLKLNLLLAKPEIALIVSLDVHSAGTTFFQLHTDQIATVASILSKFLTPKLADLLNDRDCEKVLLLQACLSDSEVQEPAATGSDADSRAFERRDHLWELIQANTFNIICTFATDQSLPADMRRWLGAALRWWATTDDGMVAAMRAAHREVSGEIFISGVVMLRVDNEKAPDATLFWNTGSKADFWTGRLKAYDGHLADACPVCDGEIKHRKNADRPGDPEKNIWCRAFKAHWQVKYHGPPDWMSYDGENGHLSGVKHRFLWSGPFPLPRIWKPLPIQYKGATGESAFKRWEDQNIRREQEGTTATHRFVSKKRKRGPQ